MGELSHKIFIHSAEESGQFRDDVVKALGNCHVDGRKLQVHHWLSNGPAGQCRKQARTQYILQNFPIFVLLVTLEYCNNNEAQRLTESFMSDEQPLITGLDEYYWLIVYKDLKDYQFLKSHHTLAIRPLATYCHVYWSQPQTVIDSVLAKCKQMLGLVACSVLQTGAVKTTKQPHQQQCHLRTEGTEEPDSTTSTKDNYDDGASLDSKHTKGRDHKNVRASKQSSPRSTISNNIDSARMILTFPVYGPTIPKRPYTAADQEEAHHTSYQLFTDPETNLESLLWMDSNSCNHATGHHEMLRQSVLLPISLQEDFDRRPVQESDPTGSFYIADEINGSNDDCDGVDTTR